MASSNGKHILLRLQRRWKTEGLVFCLLLAVAVSWLPALIVAWWVGGLVLLSGLGAALFFFPYWRLTPADVARYLDKQLPVLEESSGLLLRPEEELSGLERLQRTRTEKKLAGLSAPRPLRRKLWWGIVLLAGMVLVGAGWGMVGHSSMVAVHSAKKTVADKPVTGIRSVTIRITPPAYTGKPVRKQGSYTLRVEQGSMIDWVLETNVPVDTIQFVFNDSTKLALQPTNDQHTIWRATYAAVRPGFYQVSVAGKLSELYTLEVIKDEAPRITIRRPKAYTLLDYGESTRIPLMVRLQDDYGITDAAIVATVTSGSGEAVKFKQQEMRFGRSFSDNQSMYDLEKVLDLSALGLKPGDELYFYCRAVDNHGQAARSDMYIISLADTAQLMSMAGLTMGVNVKPEFFRSERQIIIETEQLLKEKDTISVQAFHDRSNDLGIDQKLLRLRYGKFLGEEAEEGGAPDDTSLGAAENFGNAAKVLDVYSDKHDNAEDATYFEPAIKEQLKATLSEMWKAELRLRTFQPRDALPFAYKALRLLKDLQQRSRSYVAKTGVKVTPLDTAKRLKGKLDGILPPKQRVSTVGVPASEEVLRIALAVLETSGAASGSGGKGQEGGASVGSEQGAVGWGSGSLAILQQAERRLAQEAAARPGEYLAGLQAMRRILSGIRRDDVLSAQRAIRKLLPVAEATVGVSRAPADGGLSRLYYLHMEKR